MRYDANNLFLFLGIIRDFHVLCLMLIFYIIPATSTSVFLKKIYGIKKNRLIDTEAELRSNNLVGGRFNISPFSLFNAKIKDKSPTSGHLGYWRVVIRPINNLNKPPLASEKCNE